MFIYSFIYVYSVTLVIIIIIIIKLSFIRFAIFIPVIFRHFFN